MSERVRIVWPDDAPVWDCEARLMDAPASAGLVLRDVFFCGHRVLWKASLPVVLGKTFPEGGHRLDLFGERAWPQKSARRVVEVIERPNEGDTGRVRLVIEWHRPS